MPALSGGWRSWRGQLPPVVLGFGSWSSSLPTGIPRSPSLRQYDLIRCFFMSSMSLLVSDIWIASLLRAWRGLSPSLSSSWRTTRGLPLQPVLGSGCLFLLCRAADLVATILGPSLGPHQAFRFDSHLVPLLPLLQLLLQLLLRLLRVRERVLPSFCTSGVCPGDLVEQLYILK